MPTMLLVNPKKKIKKGGKKVAKKKTSKVKSAVKKGRKIARRVAKTSMFRQIVMPTMFVVSAIVATKMVKNYVMPRLSFVPLKMQSAVSAAAIAATFYFGKRYIKSPAIWIAGALSVPVLEVAASTAPNMLAGLVDARTKQAIPFAGITRRTPIRRNTATANKRFAKDF